MHLLSSMRAMRPLAMLFFCMAYYVIGLFALTGKRDPSLTVWMFFGVVCPAVTGAALAGSLHQLVHRGTTAILPRAVGSLRAAWLVYAGLLVTVCTFISLQVKLGLGISIVGPALLLISIPLLDTHKTRPLGVLGGYTELGGILFALTLFVGAAPLGRFCMAHPYLMLAVGCAAMILVVRREFSLAAFRARQATPYLSDIALGVLGSERYLALQRFRKEELAAQRTSGGIAKTSVVSARRGSASFWYDVLNHTGKPKGLAQGRPLTVALRLAVLSLAFVCSGLLLLWLAGPERYFPQGFMTSLSSMLGSGTIEARDITNLPLVFLLCATPVLISCLALGSLRLRLVANLPISRNTLLRCTHRHALERIGGLLISVSVPSILSMCCAVWNKQPIGPALTGYTLGVSLLLLPLMGFTAWASNFRNKLILPLLIGAYSGVMISSATRTEIPSGGPLSLVTISLSLTAIFLLLDYRQTRRRVLRGDLTEDMKPAT